VLKLRRKNYYTQSPLYPTFRKRISDRIDGIIQHQVTPWAFLRTDQGVHVRHFDQREISIRGVEFEGSPSIVFWSGYIEPFLEELCCSELGAAVEMSRARGLDLRIVLRDLKGLLSGGFSRVYERMALIDQRLRGKGFPNRVTRRRVDSNVWKMDHFLEEFIVAELAMFKPKSRIELWYERNQFWISLFGIFRHAV